jgi:predicted DNA-binding protein with PD1-like motif
MEWIERTFVSNYLEGTELTSQLSLEQKSIVITWETCPGSLQQARLGVKTYWAPMERSEVEPDNIILAALVSKLCHCIIGL